MWKAAMNLPKKLNIMGKNYKVEYVDKMTDVDVDKRKAIWGQVDYWSRTIRIWKGDKKWQRQKNDLWETIIHEIIHAILEDNKVLKDLIKLNDTHKEKFVDNLAVLITDTLLRNNLIKT